MSGRRLRFRGPSTLYGVSGQSGDQFLDHFRPSLRKLLESPLMKMRQFIVIQPQLMKNRRVQVADGPGDFNRFGTNFVGRADDVAPSTS